MFTTRGYRQSKRENKYKSRQGQIIQQKPVFTIDNNPYVLEQYRKFLMGSTSTPTPTPPTPSEPSFDTDEYIITLSEYSLSWSSDTILSAIEASFLTFAQSIFTQYLSQDKYPISLELYKPTNSSSYAWSIQSLQEDNNKPKLFALTEKILIDRNGKVSYMYPQNSSATLLFGNQNWRTYVNAATLGYGHVDSDTRTYGNPSTMQMSVNYFTL